MNLLVVRIVSSTALIIPPSRGIDEPSAIQLLDSLGNRNLWEWLCAQLAPAFVVDDLSISLVSLSCESLEVVAYPGHNAGVAQMFVDQHVELPFELVLLSRVWRWHSR